MYSQEVTVKTLLLTLTMTIALAVSSFAIEYESSLGFRAQVPDSWLILTHEEVRDNPDLFEDLPLDDLPTDFAEEILAQVMRGSIEFYYFMDDTTTEFLDNIKVFKNIQQFPGTQEDLREMRRLLPKVLREAYGRSVEIHTLELRPRNGKRMLFLESEGLIPGTRNLQYMIERSSSVSLIFTLTIDETSKHTAESDFEAIVNSVEFH